jgi:hypothetical protein
MKRHQPLYPMPINIKNREAEALIAELKAATGKGTSELIVDLLRREVERQRRRLEVDERRRRIEEISREYQAKMPKNPLPHDEVIGYDENGLPT